MAQQSMAKQEDWLTLGARVLKAFVDNIEKTTGQVEKAAEAIIPAEEEARRRRIITLLTEAAVMIAVPFVVNWIMSRRKS